MSKNGNQPQQVVLQDPKFAEALYRALMILVIYMEDTYGYGKARREKIYQEEKQRREN